MKRTMKRTMIAGLAILAVAGLAGAQEPPNTVVIQGMSMGMMMGKPNTVAGAPYSGTITNESVQTLADGTRIAQKNSGTIARDSQGRTRQDAPLPSIGNLSAENAPHIVFIMDPVAQASYTLNLTEKTAQKMMMPGFGPGFGPGPGGPVTAFSGPMGAGSAGVATRDAMMMGPGEPPPTGPGNTLYFQSAGVAAGGPGVPPPPPDVFFQKAMIATDSSESKTEDLGSQTMEGLLVNGTRTTHTIPVGQIGNDRPLNIVTEVWTSPDLKIIVSSKRSDPRMGEQTFQLSNVSRGEPDVSLFSVPSDFKVVEGPAKIVYGMNR